MCASTKEKLLLNLSVTDKLPNCLEFVHNMVVLPRHREGAAAADGAGDVRAGDGQAKALGKGEQSRRDEAVSREYRCWFALSICFHACMWGYTAYKSETWRRLHAEGRMYVQGIHRGWLFGLPQDLSDPQWKTLRQFFPLLAVGIPVHSGLSLAARRLEAVLPGAHLVFYCASNLAFVLFLHGGKAIWPLLTAGVTYGIGHVFKGSKCNPALTWAFCLAVLFASDYYRGFRDWRWQGTPLAFLDEWGDGVYAWQIQYNLTMLRLVSFNMERYWVNAGAPRAGGAAPDIKGISMHARGAAAASEAQAGGRQRETERGREREDGRAESAPALAEGEREGGEKDRELSTRDEDYTWLRMVGYVFYIPLFIAGPIMTFPAWYRARARVCVCVCVCVCVLLLW